MIRALVNYIECMFYYDERFLQKHAPLGYPYMYHLRHDEDDWTRPILLERFVAVNFFGTVFMRKPIDFQGEDYLEINQFKTENKYVQIKLKTSVLGELFSIGHAQTDEQES